MVIIEISFLQLEEDRIDSTSFIRHSLQPVVITNIQLIRVTAVLYIWTSAKT